ncbi:hypothetical protein [Aquabacterium sp.]|uniref:hypothetical protein n=1 Tax=Aquabacterium sp. TaxID=1872578 RepID=UPI002B5C71DF|nr:hypothetical protein [Aquabacterium sp.]HSW08775.1 hypothetical protein [Aquabacterium sp.]
MIDNSPATTAVPDMPAAAFNQMWTWVDSGSKAALSWVEFQRMLWQPWFDMQAAWLQQCSEGAIWPGPSTWLIRGAEQLA